MMRILCFAVLIFLSASQSGWAQNSWDKTSKPAQAPNDESAREILIKAELRSSLLAAWEKNIAKDPDTKFFEKTSVPGVYDIQTDILPYKGRIKVTNFLIRSYTPTAEFDKKIGYGAIVETELLDPSKDLPGKDSLSFKEWDRLNWFNYDKTTAEWFPTNAWNQHFPSAKHIKLDTPMKLEAIPTLMDVVIMVSEVVFGVFFVVLMGFAAVYGYRQQKIRDTMGEHTQILREILAAIKEKNI